MGAAPQPAAAPLSPPPEQQPAWARAIAGAQPRRTWPAAPPLPRVVCTGSSTAAAPGGCTTTTSIRSEDAMHSAPASETHWEPAKALMFPQAVWGSLR
jgi:hypothetical protein